ncbi:MULTISPECIES: hypothetical protein [unclassified Streptomyces]|uniref:hypothetical protein n=1 Tax=unclassified Streptomyces TaxID=2593676 RepID=UPI000DC7B7BE|nr:MULTISPECIES: hypothetical protein [unclassified Streptomyces]AWZ09287.1 hypothetical protein DRB89_37795 [Streptomyces sp. ICC4]AWZ15946.1 hypothetical protein DRB96_31010 [Streptomyces sp. ICC1]
MGWVFVSYDDDCWVHLPKGSWDETPWSDEQRWAESEAICLRHFRRMPEDQEATARLARLLTTYRQGVDDDPLENYLYFEDPEDFPLVARVWYGASKGDRDSTLREWSSAKEFDHSPEIAPFSTEGFGEGIRLRGYAESEQGNMAMHLWYNLRNEEHGLDLQVIVASNELGRLAVAEPEIDAFVQGVQALADDFEFEEPDLENLPEPEPRFSLSGLLRGRKRKQDGGPASRT